MLSSLTVLLLAACAQDDTEMGQPLPDGQYPMTFTTAGITLSVETKATTDNNWQGVQTVAVKVGDEVKPYTVNPSSDYQTATLTSDDPFYWQNTAPVTVSAWWPYTDGSTAMPDVVVQADQSCTSGYQQSDYISASGKVEFNGSHALTFSHLTAKVVVKPLQRGNGIGENDLDGAAITLVGVSTGKATDATIIPYDDGTSHLALLPGQAITAGKPFIQVTLADGTVYNYKPDEAITLQAGYQYTYTITVNKASLGVENATISSWGNGGEVSDEALPELPNEINLADVTEKTLTVSGKVTIKGDGTTPKDLQITVAPDTELTLQDVNLSYNEGPTIICQGTAHITLCGNNQLSPTSKGADEYYRDLGSGIEVRSSGTLTIESEPNATLTITRRRTDTAIFLLYGAGIGLYENANLVIKGGTITVTGGSRTAEGGANIGGFVSQNAGTITLEGGTFTLQDQCMLSSLIGAGTYGTCGKVTIRAGVTINGTTYKEDHVGAIKE